MYEPPLEVFINQLFNNLDTKLGDEVAVQVSMQVGVEVDKDELLKCLQYDRNQYDLGYKDGYRDGAQTAINPFPYEAVSMLQRYCENYAGCKGCPLSGQCDKRPFNWELKKEGEEQ